MYRTSPYRSLFLYNGGNGLPRLASVCLLLASGLLTEIELEITSIISIGMTVTCQTLWELATS